MNKVLVIILTLLLWAFASWFYYSQATGGAFCRSLPSFSYVAKDLSLKAPETFSFARSGTTPTIPGETKSRLTELGKYLKSNDKATVNVTGFYSGQEKNSSKFKNLGLARAEAIKNVLLGHGCKAEQVRVAEKLIKEDASQADDIFISDRVYGGIVAPGAALAAVKAPPAVAPAVGFSVSGEGQRFGTKENFLFPMGSDVPVIPATTEKELGKLAAYQKTDAGNVVELTGQYARTEKNKTKYENLGIARAAKIRENLVKKGVPQDQVILKSKMIDAGKFNADNKLLGGVLGKIIKVKASDTGADIFKPRNVYFETNSYTMRMDLELKQFLENAKAYLAKNPGKKAILTGHTDNQGDAGANMELGRKRAKFIKDYLGAQGVKVGQMSSSSKGETSPIADNKTAKGRAENRRVEILIK